MTDSYGGGGRGGGGRGGSGMGRGGGGRGGGGRGGGGGFAMGPGGVCICPKCNTETPHQRGTICRDIKCPQCGTPMTRKM